MDSLTPGESLMIALADGDPRAYAITESWKFTFPATTMNGADLDELSERCRTTFHFPRSGGELRSDL